MRAKRCTMCNKRARDGYLTCSDECGEARRWRQHSLNRHRKRSKVPGIFTITVEDWTRILRRYNHRCAYCGRTGDMTLDHVVPLSRGGRHSIGNIVPACKNCNQKKGSLTVAEWKNYTRSQIQSAKQKLNNKMNLQQNKPWVVHEDLGIRPINKKYKNSQTPIFGATMQAQHDRIILQRMGITVDHFGPIS